MNIEVRYFSKTGNTKKIADVISKEIGCVTKNIDEPINNVDILFIGASIYAGGIDKQVLSFLDKLTPEIVGKVAVFSTSAMQNKGFTQIKNLLQKKGIEVAEDNFYCKGKFAFMHKNRPNEEDFNMAKEFTKTIIG